MFVQMEVLDMSYERAGNLEFQATNHTYFIALDMRCKMPPECLPLGEILQPGASWVRTIFDCFVRVVAIANASIVALGAVAIVGA